MRAPCAVVAAPALGHNLRLGEAAEDHTIEQFIPELRVGDLAKAVLSWAAWRDFGGQGTDSGDPLPDGLGDEPWAD